MRFLVPALILSLIPQVGHAQQSFKMPKNFKPITADDIVKPRPTNQNAPLSSSSPEARTQAKAWHEAHAKQRIANNMGLIVGGLIGFVATGFLLIWLRNRLKWEDPGWREVLFGLLVIGMLAGLGVFKAIFSAAAIGSGGAMVVSFLIKQAAKSIVKRLD